MSRLDKTLSKMRNNPKDWRMAELEYLAEKLGITIRKSGGSHVVFQHAKWQDMLCIPAHRPIKPVYIKKLIALIDTLEAGDD